MDRKELSKIIGENALYFMTDPGTRRNIVDRECKYVSIKPSSDGCFVGRLIDDKNLCKFMDDCDESGIGDIFEEFENEIPDILKDNQSLMINFQFWHDTNHFWDLELNKLNREGLDKLKDTIAKFDLDKSDFDL